MHHYYRTAAWALAFLIAVAATLWTVLIITDHPDQAREASTGVGAGGAAVIIILGFMCLLIESDE